MIVKCGGTVTQCNSDSKVRWNSDSVTVTVKCGETVAQSNSDSKVWWNSDTVEH